jgi:hypothetical protein
MTAAKALFRTAMFSKDMDIEQSIKLYQLLVFITELPAEEIQRLHCEAQDTAIQLNEGS